MNAKQATEAARELRALSHGNVMFKLDGMTLIQRCKICDAHEEMIVEVSDDGDERLYHFQKTFLLNHRHDS